MMFASNQKLKISGCLEHQGELFEALTFALKFSGELECFARNDRPATCVYQITDDGRYCIGWAFEGIKEGWKEFGFDFDLDIISEIITKYLRKQEKEVGIPDGAYHKGFLMKVIKETMADEKDGIKNPFYGIVSFEPYTCFYSK